MQQNTILKNCHHIFRVNFWQPQLQDYRIFFCFFFHSIHSQKLCSAVARSQAWSFSKASLTLSLIGALTKWNALRVTYSVYSVYDQFKKQTSLLLNEHVASFQAQFSLQAHEGHLKIPRRGKDSECHTFTWQNRKHTFPSVPHKRLQAGNANRPPVKLSEV